MQAQQPSSAENRDAWVDQLYDTAEAHKRSRGWRAPLQKLRSSVSFLRTTPGLMTLMCVVLSLVIAGSGFGMSAPTALQQQSLSTLLDDTEPTASSALSLYSALSSANTVATSGIVQAGAESAESRAAFQEDMDQAMIALTEIAVGLPENQHADLLTIQRYIPIYSGLVESARANNQAGNPVGVAYMAEAAELMNGTILPTADRLFDTTSREVLQQQHRLTRLQVLPFAGLLFALVMLLMAQWWLWRITRRRINRGFAVATVLLAVSTLWVATSSLATWQAGSVNFTSAQGPWQSLTAARTQAQQAHTDETMALVRRQAITNAGTSFSRASTSLDDALSAAAEDFPNPVGHAQETLNQWTTAHQSLAQALNEGNYEEVNAASIRTTQTFSELDDALDALIDQIRSTMRSSIAAGLGASSALPGGLLVLSVLAVISVWVGIRPRLQEYL